MSGAARRTSPEKSMRTPRLTRSPAALLAVLVVASTGCSDRGNPDPLGPLAPEVAHEVTNCHDPSGPTEDCPPITLTPIDVCPDDPDDPICTEEDDEGCIPINDPNWCEDPDSGGSGGGDPGGGGSSDPPTVEGSVSLECDKNVPRGDEGGCTLSGTEGVTLSNIAWTAQVRPQRPRQVQTAMAPQRRALLSAHSPGS